ncbi:MAG: ABC transporter ATP-binding protein [Nitrososphaerota archaeon]|jgi:ABC-2 type transport system ATP-binding protein|nr:ABC transporter ATP-binding protein [Nitrososphaerota archaeon]
MANLSLEAVNLTKRYGQFTALDNLNLKIEGTKCVGFLGPNGAGKTTTLKIFTDMIRPTKGEALINGIPVHKNKRLALAHIGDLIESPEIYPSFTPNEALSMVADLRGVPKSGKAKRIEEAIAEVKMEEWKDKKVGKFSKGMKQRINIAAALLSEPDIIILDEPTTGLDPRGMSEVREIVKSLKRKSRLIFMSSHLLPEVSDVCDEVAMIDHGKLLVYDTLENVTAKFSGDGNSTVEVGFSRAVEENLTRNISSLSGVISVDKLDSRNLRVKFSGGALTQERLLSEIGSMKVGALSFRAGASALEDTYLNLIKETL